MVAFLIARLKAREDENRRLKKMVAEERLNAEIVVEALKKNGSAILSARDGAAGDGTSVCHGRFGMPGIWHQPSEQQF